MERLLPLRAPAWTRVALGRSRSHRRCSNAPARPLMCSSAPARGSGTPAQALAGLRPQERTGGTAARGGGDSVEGGGDLEPAASAAGRAACGAPVRWGCTNRGEISQDRKKRGGRTGAAVAREGKGAGLARAMSNGVCGIYIYI